MSVLQWLLVAVIAYFANNAYQRIQLARKKAEFIRDRRRAAGIPDDDHRPFAVARADALSRRSQQSRDEALSTPVRKHQSRSPSRSQSRLDHDTAARLSGIPGTLPGYLKHSFSADAASSSRRRNYELNPIGRSSSPRSPSPVKHRDFERYSPQKMQRASSKRSTAKGEHEPAAEPGSSPSTHRTLKRQASPTKSEAPVKAPKVAIPGTFADEQETLDEEMSDAAHPHDEAAEAMDEEETEEISEVKNSSPANGKRKASVPQDQLHSLGASARATAKKREADELDDSDTEQSAENSDDEEHADTHPHSSKRSRRANKDMDPSSSLDFDMALPEEAMADFIPIHDVSSSNAEPTRTSSKAKREADTSDDRQPGEEWTDFEGLRWRIHPTTHELQRWSDILERRSKYRMPRDSLHPMAKESHQVVVSKWLTKEEWEDAKAKKLLSFQEPERLAEKERQDKEDAEKMRRKQELLAKIRETASPNKRIQSYLAQQQRRQLQHRSSDVSMHSYNTAEGDETTSMSIDTSSMLGGEEATPGKPRSRRISLHSRMTPARGGDAVGSLAGRDSKSTSGVSSPSDSPNRRRGSPLASPYRPIQYPPRSKKTTPANGSPLVTSFPPPSTGS